MTYLIVSLLISHVILVYKNYTNKHFTAIISYFILFCIIAALTLLQIPESADHYINQIYFWRWFIGITVLFYFWLLTLSKMLELTWNEKANGFLQKLIKAFIIAINLIPFLMLTFYRFVIRKETEEHPLRLKKALITTLPIIFISFLLSTLAIGDLQKAWNPNELQKAAQFIGIYKDTPTLEGFDTWLQLVGIKPVVASPKLKLDPAGVALAVATVTPLGPVARIASVLRFSSKAKHLIIAKSNKTKIKSPSRYSTSKKKLEDLPKEAQETYNRVLKGGPHPHKKDGTTFKNREHKLPRQEPGYYKEYTVDTPGISNRGTRRIIQGKNGELYYTDDHYNSFSRIKVE